MDASKGYTIHEFVFPTNMPLIKVCTLLHFLNYVLWSEALGQKCIILPHVCQLLVIRK